MSGYEIFYGVPEGWGIFGLENVNFQSGGLQWPTLRMPKMIKINQGSINDDSDFEMYYDIWNMTVLCEYFHQNLIYDYFIVCIFLGFPSLSH